MKLLYVRMNIEQEVRELRMEGYLEGELSIEPFWYIIFEPENVVAYNRDYETAKYAPGFVAFGSNGGGELLVIDSDGVVFTLPMIGMEPRYAKQIAKNITDLKSYMAPNI